MIRKLAIISFVLDAGQMSGDPASVDAGTNEGGGGCGCDASGADRRSSLPGTTESERAGILLYATEGTLKAEAQFAGAAP
jgi:hypothetical protein